jgi:hypothetical protein
LLFCDVREVSFPITDSFEEFFRCRTGELNAFVYLTILKTSAVLKKIEKKKEN